MKDDLTSSYLSLSGLQSARLSSNPRRQQQYIPKGCSKSKMQSASHVLSPILGEERTS